MTNTITLTASMRSNLSSLKSLASQMSTTQTRLSTGKKVNSAIDNANSYYQARALTNRAGDLDSLLDSMGQSIQTITAASEAIDSGLSLIEQMKSVAQSAIGNIDNLPQKFDHIEMGVAHDGRANTQAMIDQLGEKALLATACNQFYAPGVSADDENFGQGKWYLPAIGELIDTYSSKFVYITPDMQNFKFNLDTWCFDTISLEEWEQLSDNYFIKLNENVEHQEDIFKQISKEEYEQFLAEHNGDGMAVYHTDGIAVFFGLVKEINFNNSPEYYSDDEKYYKIINAQTPVGEVTEKFIEITEEEYEQFVDTHGSEEFYYNNDSHHVERVFGTHTVVDWTSPDHLEKLLNTYFDGSEMIGLQFTPAYYSSSEVGNTIGGFVFSFDPDMVVPLGYKSDGFSTRAFTLLENKFTNNVVKPAFGDVMYSDLSYSDKDHIDTSKTAVGIVTWVSDDGASARIMSLKDLTFSSRNQVGNFDPTNPYDNAEFSSYVVSNDTPSEINFEGITDTGDFLFPYDTNINSLSKDDNIYNICAKSNPGEAIFTTDFSAYTEQFNAIYSQYDAMVKDASYQGINLLNGGNLNVMFNETRTHSHQVNGYHADAAALGINTAAWSEAADIEATITQLQNATSRLRNIAGDLGNHLSIIETRQDFTDNLIDVLETGADNLVLADMNEESANYLALQTRQQLAVNSLSLASQSAQSVLSLF